ncbi:MAG TPA: hypothetical protein VLW06_02640 [Terriglobales bacterium]|nr:hypothetical protein [Terriglobales bacterium]
MDKNVPFTDLIPSLREHWATNDIDQWISIEGDFEHLVGYSRVLWPEFMEYDDCVFRTLRFTEENYRGFMEQTNGDKAAVEAVMNHEHILDIFSNASIKPSQSMVLYVGRLLKDIWDAKLKRDFPARRITVSFPEGPFEDPLQYEVSFFQEQ